jgi:hypothetical protein
MLVNTATVIAFVVSILIPAISSLVTSVKWPPEIAGYVTLFLSAANGFFTEWGAHPHDYHWQAGLVTAIISYLIAVASRLQLWQGTTIDHHLIAFPYRAAPEYRPDHEAA